MTDTGKKASPVDVDKRLVPVAKVIQSPDFNPDIICIEECCNQKDLEYFNHHWLKDAYEKVIVLPGTKALPATAGSPARPVRTRKRPPTTWTVALL